MSLWKMPQFVSDFFSQMAALLDKRSRPRLWAVLCGLLLCREKRRTVSAWFRAAGIGAEFRQAYYAIGSVGRRVQSLASAVLSSIDAAIRDEGDRLVFALDDTPTKRYGPCVEGAGVHRNPTPGPANQEFVYGHVWVTLARVVRHALWGAMALPVQAELYVRRKSLDTIPPEYAWPFRTKLELAAALIDWLRIRLASKTKSIWLVMDGAYAKRQVLSAAKAANVYIVSRLRLDAALQTVPDLSKRPPGRRGPKPIYGDKRISLAKRAGAKGGWQSEVLEMYNRLEEKIYKTFLATWRPAGGVIRVVLVKNADGWVAYFSTNLEATAAEILELVADRAAIEQVFHDVKEVWGAGQQQLRHIYANVGAWHLNLWAYTLVELWAWERGEDELVDRSASPWDRQWRRPSHADRRKSLMCEMLREEIQAAAEAEDQNEKLLALAERLLSLAA
jgi:hypothetical protein